MYVGGMEGFISCLYFEIPPHLYGKAIESARLILYKYPVYEPYRPGFDAAYQRGGPYDAARGWCPVNVTVSPLLEFFSKYSPCFSIPQADCGSTVISPVDECLCYTEIDISRTAERWIRHTLDNRGLLIAGCCPGRMVCYASEKDPDKGLRPVIRLTYQDLRELASVPCVVSVK